MSARWVYLLAFSILGLAFTAFCGAVTWWLKDPQYRTPQWLLDWMGG